MSRETDTLDTLYTLYPGTPKIVPDKYAPLEIPNRVRDDIPTMLDILFKDQTRIVGAEIGVERAVFSEVLLRSPRLELHLIDPWQAYPGYRDHVTQEKLNGFYEHVQEIRQKYPQRTALWRMTSVEAARNFADFSLDFVYIDGNHTLPYVIMDLAAWTRKVRPGGLIMGHDYRKPKNNIGHHVVEAVNAWTYGYRICPWFLLGAKGDEHRDQNRTFFWVAQ